MSAAIRTIRCLGGPLPDRAGPTNHYCRHSTAAKVFPKAVPLSMVPRAYCRSCCPQQIHPLVAAYIEAGVSIGAPRLAEHNGGPLAGVAPNDISA
jgi:hypothetical protein